MDPKVFAIGARPASLPSVAIRLAEVSSERLDAASHRRLVAVGVADVAGSGDPGHGDGRASLLDGAVRLVPAGVVTASKTLSPILQDCQSHRSSEFASSVGRKRSHCPPSRKGRLFMRLRNIDVSKARGSIPIMILLAAIWGTPAAVAQEGRLGDLMMELHKVICPPRTDPTAMRVPSGPGWTLRLACMSRSSATAPISARTRRARDHRDERPSSPYPPVAGGGDRTILLESWDSVPVESLVAASSCGGGGYAVGRPFSWLRGRRGARVRRGQGRGKAASTEVHDGRP